MTENNITCNREIENSKNWVLLVAVISFLNKVRAIVENNAVYYSASIREKRHVLTNDVDKEALSLPPPEIRKNK